MKNENFDGGTVQDIFHYALACAHRRDGAFPIELLRQRLTAAEALQNLLRKCDDGSEAYPFKAQSVMELKRESDMKDLGESTLTLICEIGAEIGIDPRSGNTCRVGQMVRLQRG